MPKKNYGFEIGDYARLRSTPRYGWVKVMGFKRIDGVLCASCEHTVNKDDTFGFKRWFRLVDLLKDVT